MGESSCQLSPDAQRCLLSPVSDNQLSAESQPWVHLSLFGKPEFLDSAALEERGGPATVQVASLAKKRQNPRVPAPPCSPTASAPPTSEHSPCPRPRNGPVGVTGQEAARGLVRHSAQRTAGFQVLPHPDLAPHTPT